MRQRQHGDDPPPYVLFPGEETKLHSRGGSQWFFLWMNYNLQYVSATTEHFDNCTYDTWSMFWVDEILRQLGYNRDGRVSVYWLLPGKDFLDGLMLIENQVDIRQMINASKAVKNLVLFVDQNGFLKNLRPEMIVRHPNATCHAPANPPSVHAESSSNEEANVSKETPPAVAEPLGNSMKRQHGHEEEQEDEVEEEDESSEDSDFVDSDFNALSGDDDLYAENIDKSVNDHNEKELVEVHEDKEAPEDDDLAIKGGEKQLLLKGMKPFNAEIDMNNPVFSIGMKFTGVEELRRAIATYAIKNRKKIKKTRNERRRFEAHCSEGCSWLRGRGPRGRGSTTRANPQAGEPKAKASSTRGRARKKRLDAQHSALHDLNETVLEGELEEFPLTQNAPQL